MEIGATEIAVYWITPYAFDHSGAVTVNSSHEAGQIFPVGSTDIVYHFEDESRNRAECNFTVFVEYGKLSILFEYFGSHEIMQGVTYEDLQD